MVKATTISPKHSTAPKLGTSVVHFPLLENPDRIQCYWSLQDGNETSTWADALLTPVGEGQAKKANDFWRSQMKDQKIPTPESYYTSPLLRCLATASITFSGLDLPKEHPFIPTIKENLREVIGAHTCDRRSSKTVIHSHYLDCPL